MSHQLEQEMTTPTDGEDWRKHLIDAPDKIKTLLDNTRRVAVLGMKPDPNQPAYYVPEHASMAGMEVIPVPVYYPELTEIMGRQVYRKLVDIPGPIDLVDVFRRPKDIPQHVDDMIAKMPKVVWFQLVIRNDEAAERLARAGIDVVQDHCLLVELRRIGK